ncbi:aromatic amino acid aminotransferase [Paramyrothecium foliicola]|nr:aromatic amino acid aminotransferase [Paramyrothecium foliicola]
MSYSTCDRVSPECPVENTIYGGYFTLGATATYATMFGLFLTAQVPLAFRARLWSYGSWLAAGTGFEFIGYVCRSVMVENPWNFDAFIAQNLCLVLGPTLVAAAISVTFKHLVLWYGPEYSLIRPNLYPWVFVGTDFISICIQGAGGGIASAADNDESVFTLGNNLLLAGVSFQVVNMTLCGGLIIAYGLRRRQALISGPIQATDTGEATGTPAETVISPCYHGTDESVHRNRKSVRLFIWALASAYIAIVIRCIYRSCVRSQRKTRQKKLCQSNRLEHHAHTLARSSNDIQNEPCARPTPAASDRGQSPGASRVRLLETPHPQPDFLVEGSSSFPAQSRYAHDFLLAAVRENRVPVPAAGGLRDALDGFKELTETTRGLSALQRCHLLMQSLFNGQSPSYKCPHLSDQYGLPATHKDHGPCSCWVFEYLLLPCPQFSELLLKVYFDSYCEIDAITINAVLYSLFMDEARNVNGTKVNEETEMNSLDAAQLWRANLETALSRLPLILPATRETIIALLYGAYYAIEISKPSLSWSLISKASELCLTLGYHRSGSSKDKDTATVQFEQPLFWSAYFLDKSTSLRLGRPSHIPDWDVSIPLPHDARPQRDASLAYFRSWLRAVWCEGRIYLMLYSADAEAQSHEIRRQRLDEIVGQLKEVVRESDQPTSQNGWYSKAKHRGDERLAECHRLNDRILQLSLLSLAYRASPSVSGFTTFTNDCIAVVHEDSQAHGIRTDGTVSPFEKIRRRRAQAGRLNAGIAALSDSDCFKEPPKGDKPVAKDWSGIFSRESLARSPCILKKNARFLKNKGLISLGSGLPSSDYFPYSEIALRVLSPPNASEEDPALLSKETFQTAVAGKNDAREGISEYDLSIALNYGQATGAPQMIRFITEHTELIFNPPYADWRVCATVGSTGALEQAIRLLCDRNRKDSILVEDYTFPSALDTIRPQGINVVGIKMDEEGLLPDDMDRILSTWDAEARGFRKPHILYTVPSGQNPTGATQGIQRRREIYSVCQKHDIYVLEDDPYYFLQMQAYKGRTTEDSGKADVENSETLSEFMSSLVPSFLTLDVDGRVMRMDSFSKVLIPGSRMGWITASKQVIEKFLYHADVANQGPGGLVQIVLWKLLDEQWGHEGYVRWLLSLKVNYTGRRNMLLAACEDFLPRNLITWTPPSAGMFLWLKVDHLKHPDYPQRQILDLEEEIFTNAIDNGVLCAKGSWFRADPRTQPKELFFRVTFATASEEAMGLAIQRLSAAIKKSFNYA